MIVELPTLPRGDARVLREALTQVYDIRSDIRIDNNRLYMRDAVTGEMFEMYMDRGTLMIRREGDTSDAWNAGHGVYGFGGRFTSPSTTLTFAGTGQANAQRLRIYQAADEPTFIQRNIAFDTGSESRLWTRNDYRHEVYFDMLMLAAGTGGQGTDYYVQWRQAETGDWIGSGQGPFSTRQDDIHVSIIFATVVDSPAEPESVVGYELWGWCESRAGSLTVEESTTIVKRV